MPLVLYLQEIANSAEDWINHVMVFPSVCMFVVCVCFLLCCVISGSTHYTHTHTYGLAEHFEESKQRIFHQLCELAVFGPAVTALQSICLR